MATINTIEDLIQLLDDNPRWVEALRVRLLTRELIELSEKLAKFSDPINQRFDRIEGLLDRLIDDVAMLRGAYTRDAARRQADLIAEDLGFRLVRILSRDDLCPLIRSQYAADIPASHLRSFRLADLLMEAANQDGEMAYVAAEISFTVNGQDVTRAVRNAGFLSRFTGKPAHAAVAGACLGEGIRNRLVSEGVFWYELSMQSLDAG